MDLGLAVDIHHRLQGSPLVHDSKGSKPNCLTAHRVAWQLLFFEVHCLAKALLQLQ